MRVVDPAVGVDLADVGVVAVVLGADADVVDRESEFADVAPDVPRAGVVADVDRALVVEAVWIFARVVESTVEPPTSGERSPVAGRR